MKIVFIDGTPCIKKESDIDPLRRLGEVVVYNNMPDSEIELVQRASDANIIYTDLTRIKASLMDKCPNLEMICFLGVGASSHVDIPAATQRGIVVTTTPNYGNNAVAEHAITLMFCAARRVIYANKKLMNGQWDQSKFTGIEITGKTLGLVGLGPIAARVAELGQALNMELLCWTRRPSPERARKHGVKFVSLEELFRKADVVSIHLPGVPETQKLINRSLLELMKPTAILVNTARGEIVDNEALAELLQKGRIAAAAVDVFEEEPPPRDYPLLKLDNVIATPHIAYNTKEANKNMLRIAIDNAIQYCNGNPINVENPEVLKK